MIQRIRLRNFKAFRDTRPIELKPITILAGPNSSGKTSIIQSLLLLKQTVESDEPDVALNLDGRFLQFSSLAELTYGRPALKSCRVSYHLTLENLLSPRLLRAHYPGLRLDSRGRAVPVQSELRFSFKHQETAGGKTRLGLDRFELLSRVGTTLGPRLTLIHRDRRYQVKMEGAGIDIPKALADRRIAGATLRHFHPSLLLTESEDPDAHSAVLALHPIFQAPLSDLEGELKGRLHYLGPLREAPRRAYLHSGSQSAEIGQRGEYAAQILWLERDDLVTFAPLPGQAPVDMPLKDAVADVFRRIGMNQPLTVQSIRSVIYQVLLGLPGTKRPKHVTVADVGFGVSQLLPVVVFGLRSPEDSLLLLEQPEIHLHPRLQANLADFLLMLASSGVRLLVETHSDHLINRLRRRIAEDRTNLLKHQVSILFVSATEKRGSVVTPLTVNEFGAIENWPPDFLPETSDEAQAILEAGLKKRQDS
jgi:predicted ATPase